MHMLQVEESRLVQLVNRETNYAELFEAVVLMFCKQWRSENPTTEVNFCSDREEWEKVSNYINEKLVKHNIHFGRNNEIPKVWFNSGNSLLYWGFRDSCTIHGIGDILKL